MDKPSASLTNWFAERPRWLQEAVVMLNNGSTLDIERLLKLCINESNGELNESLQSFTLNNYTTHPIGHLLLRSIYDLQGINALAPKKPLTFTSDNITVVFGNNGSGKSGYVRLLKHISGARTVSTLHGNVYRSEPIAQKATILVKKGEEDKCLVWNGSHTLDEFSAIDVFDTLFGRIYIAEDNEIRYEPPLLALFSELISCCDSLVALIDERISSLIQAKPQMPNHLTETSAGKWYATLTAKTSKDEMLNYSSLTDTDLSSIVQLEKRLQEKAPIDKANLLRKQKQHFVSIANDVKNCIDRLSVANANALRELKITIDAQESALALAASEFSSNTTFNVGSEVWRELWNAARKYSTDVAYKNQEFPYVGDTAHCVLCQQPLGDGAKKRLLSFESFVKGELELSHRNSIEKYRNMLSMIEDIPTIESISTKIDAAGEHCIVLREKITTLFNSFRERKDAIVLVEKGSSISNDFDDMGLLAEIDMCAQKLEEQAIQFENDAKSDNRGAVKSQLSELSKKKWVSENSENIIKEIQRLHSIEILSNAKKHTNTRALSQKKGELSEELITNAFIQRFNDELNVLGASHIKVELTMTRVNKGRVLHKIQLRDAHANCPLSEVLSEGESRIVSIAAFLADVTGYGVNTPLIFDDPISSLDQGFEEKVAFRLSALACNRQVIIFTHRLSLLGLIRRP